MKKKSNKKRIDSKTNAIHIPHLVSDLCKLTVKENEREKERDNMNWGNLNDD